MKNQSSGTLTIRIIPFVLAFGVALTLAVSEIIDAPAKTVLDTQLAQSLPTFPKLAPPVITQCNADETTDQVAATITELEDIVVPMGFTEEQAELLIYAYNVAKSDGLRDPTVLQGIIWQESKAGGYPGHEVAGDEFGLTVGKRYYGVGQIKVSAAKDVFRRFPDEFSDFYEAPKKIRLANGKQKRVPGRYLMPDEEIIAYLIIDKKFNIRVASKYIWLMGRNEKTNFLRPINYAITAYNRGLGNTYGSDYDNWHYTVSVNKYRNGFIKKFNKANKTRLKL